MCRLMLYAGYDPNEDSPARCIDAREARRLRGLGLRWREVAFELSVENGRAVAYTADAVAAAARRMQ